MNQKPRANLTVPFPYCPHDGHTFRYRGKLNAEYQRVSCPYCHCRFTFTRELVHQGARCPLRVKA